MDAGNEQLSGVLNLEIGFVPARAMATRR